MYWYQTSLTTKLVTTYYRKSARSKILCAGTMTQAQFIFAKRLDLFEYRFPD